MTERISQTETTIYADISTNGTALKNEDTIRLIVMAGNNNAEAVNSSAKTSTNYIESQEIVINTPGEIRVEKYSGFGGCEAAEVCQNRTQGETDIKLASFVIFSSPTIEPLKLTKLIFGKMEYAEDYENIFIKEYNGDDILATCQPNSEASFACNIDYLLNAPHDVFYIYASKIAENATSAGLVAISRINT